MNLLVEASTKLEKSKTKDGAFMFYIFSILPIDISLEL